MNRLAAIVARRREDIAAVRALYPDAARADALAAPAPRGFRRALAGPGLSVIAEIKRRAPSAGELNAGADAASQAARYAAAGAAAISVLTEEAHFGGRIEDLAAARGAQHRPLLRKDFIVDPAQLTEARIKGADAVLLIAAVLGRELGGFCAAAAELGLDALVEVHDEAEIDLALEAGADLVGINNRDLTDLSVDLTTFERLRPRLPAGIVAVAESGVEDAEAARRMRDAGADAILVGTALMRAPDPAALLAALRLA